MNLIFKPVTNKNWEDFENLFGEKGAYVGCWCMFWRLNRKEFNQSHGDANKAKMRELIEAGQTPGIIAYDNKIPIGWCSVAPKGQYKSLGYGICKSHQESNNDIWSIVCFFVDKPFRGKGVVKELIKASVRFAFSNGATHVEAYPKVSGNKKITAVTAYSGLLSTFIELGFIQIEMMSSNRAIVVRYMHSKY